MGAQQQAVGGEPRSAQLEAADPDLGVVLEGVGGIGAGARDQVGDLVPEGGGLEVERPRQPAAVSDRQVEAPLGLEVRVAAPVGVELTVTTTFIALLPILWATGIGSDVMRRIAAPMVGGIVTSFVGELVVYPSLYFIWRSLKLERSALFGKAEAELAP